MIESSFNKSSTEVLGNSMASNDEGRLEVKVASSLVVEEEDVEALVDDVAVEAPVDGNTVEASVDAAVVEALVDTGTEETLEDADTEEMLAEMIEEATVMEDVKAELATAVVEEVVVATE